MLNTATDSVNTYRTTLKTTPVMKAARFHGRGDIRVEEIEEPRCGKGQVKMRPSFVGICGSDIHEYSGGPVLVPEKPHAITGTSLPVTLGHEFSGIVEEVGEGVTHISPGQRAVVRPTIFDRECTPCKQGYEYCCEKIGFIGLSGYGGGLAKYIVAPAEHFYTIPDNVSLEAAALVEPLAVAWHAVNISPFKPNDNVLVLGGGPVGIGIIQVLALQGAKNIIVAELTENRKRFASSYGANHILDPREVDVATKVRELTDGVGADVVFDTAGVEVALNGAIAACRTHGTIVNIAVWEKRPAIRVNELMYSEVNYTGSALYDESAFREVIRALSYGQLKPERMVTSKIKLDEVVEKGFQALVNDRDSHCKILVDVQA
ncbi:alcohol dehydrogenase [Aspergillus eucalypticola CBS 122712]|uniref:Alcohol dehydrogenase n=1 Tax=Aspergillus eucalypticola (strain CBS 122712 / IBT 29274) TaxID=1448314 RepID=A0A317W365_ASPEC|nr:alcohol dehydrogenase [Aspergillus eucalypticola CBS 122712]PWY81046.1 alcohol dehydrogenase [Aspergillus eucalypticola CBS 122712]